MANLELWTNC